jgi:hypothetical protein
MDQGSQFTAEEFAHVVLGAGCKLSMDGRGACRAVSRPKRNTWFNEPKSGSYPVAGSASAGLKGPSVGAILSLT